MKIGDKFRDAFYVSMAWERTTWLGHRVLKCPLDMWLYQELICQTRPDVLVEVGTYEGGSAMFFASVFDALGHGRVISIDAAPRACPPHPRVEYRTAKSPGISHDIARELSSVGKVAVCLDSDHSPEHVANEIRAFAPLVSHGQFMVVEDTFEYDLDGKPNNLQVVVAEFMASDQPFHYWDGAEKFQASFNPGGWLIRTR